MFYCIGGIDDKQEKELTKPVRKKYPDDAIVSVAKGELEPLAEVKDEAFASGALGKGVAIKLDSDFVCAPANGKITALFPTGHAFGITTKKGVELLVHIGINTVNLQGKGFDILVDQGDKVEAGQPIVKVNRATIEKEGYDLTTMLIITNLNGQNIKLKKTVGHVDIGTKLN